MKTVGGDTNLTSLRMPFEYSAPNFLLGALMRLWKQPGSVTILTTVHVDTVVTYLDVEFLRVGDDFLRARVPLDQRHGLLQGGISAVLAETLDSCGAPLS